MLEQVILVNEADQEIAHRQREDEIICCLTNLSVNEERDENKNIAAYCQ